MIYELINILNDEINNEKELCEHLIKYIVKTNNLSIDTLNKLRSHPKLKDTFEKSYIDLYNEEYYQHVISIDEILSGQKLLESELKANAKDVEKLLKINYIPFETEKAMIQSPISNQFLRFDYYLPEYNLAIEFDGIQHFQPIEYFGGEETFQKTQFLDQYKNEMCKELHIDLIRVPYYYTKRQLSMIILHKISKLKKNTLINEEYSFWEDDL